MVSQYTTTEYQFGGWRLPELRDPVLRGAGHGSLEAAADAYRKYADIMESAAEGVRAALTTAQDAHEGSAADASRCHIARLGNPGDAGAAHARLAALALEDQAAHYVHTRNEMQALAGIGETAPDPAVGSWAGRQEEAFQQAREAARQRAVDVANVYQSNTNHNLGTAFQVFEPPQVGKADVSSGPATASPDWGGGSAGVAAASAGAGSVAPAAVGGVPAGAAVPADGPAGGVGGAGGVSAGVAAVPRGAATAAGARPVGGPPTMPTGGAGSPVTTPQANRPGGATPAPGPGIGSATRRLWQDLINSRATTDPVLTGPGAGSMPGRGPGGAGTGGEGRVSGQRPPSGAAGGEAASRGLGARAGSVGGIGAGHVPLMPGGAGGRREEHRRPSWLVEDDPEAVWLAGLPEHGPPVIEGEESLPGRV